MAKAAYEHEEKAPSRVVALAPGAGPSPASARSIRWRGIQAWTIAGTKDPKTSAQVDEDRYGIDVLTPIAAVWAALDKVALGLLDDHAQHCVAQAAPDEREAQTGELLAAVGRLMRRG
jgi:DNA-binding FrmR family transcriptional regulator